MQYKTMTVSFEVSKTLRKPLQLPDKNEWKVHDFAISDWILCNTTDKGWFWNSKGSVAMRFVTVTRNGFVIVYLDDDKGFVLNIHEARTLTSESTQIAFNSKSMQTQRQCLLKLKYKFGTLNLYLKDDEIPAWKKVLNEFFELVRLPEEVTITGSENDETENSEGISEKTALRSVSEVSIVNSIGAIELKTATNSDSLVSLTETFIPSTVEPEKNTPKKDVATTVKTASETSLGDTAMMTTTVTTTIAPTVTIPDSDSSNSGLITEHPEENSSLTETLPSVRSGYVSVASLRRRLERKMSEKAQRNESIQTVRDIRQPTFRPISTIFPKDEMKVVEPPVPNKRSKIPPPKARRQSFKSFSEPSVKSTSTSSLCTVIPARPKCPPPASPPTMNRKVVVESSYTSWDKSVRA